VGALDIAGRPPVASCAAVGVTAGDVVLVSAAADEVGGPRWLSPAETAQGKYQCQWLVVHSDYGSRSDRA